MRNFLKVLAVSMMLVPALFPQKKKAQGKAPQGKTSQDKPEAAADVRFSVDMLDKNIDPCNDFYAYACSRWLAHNPIPADRSSWGRFNELAQRGEYIVRDILEKAEVDRQGRSANEQKIGDYYASCMDEGAIEKAGTKPLEQDFHSIAAIQSKPELTKEIVRLHREGTDVLFGFDSGSDFKNASQMIGQADQGGLGMPDRDYYFKDDAKSVELRKQYVEHVQKMLELVGDPAAKAGPDAQAVMRFETGLAKGSLELVARRDPNQTYHKLTVHELFSLNPAIDWPKYFQGVGAPPITDLNVAVPNFFRTVESMI